MVAEAVVEGAVAAAAAADARVHRMHPMHQRHQLCWSAEAKMPEDVSMDIFFTCQLSYMAYMVRKDCPYYGYPY